MKIYRTYHEHRFSRCPRCHVILLNLAEWLKHVSKHYEFKNIDQVDLGLLWLKHTKRFQLTVKDLVSYAPMFRRG